MKRILLFERFINSKAYKATNAVNDTDDVKQEIYMHLIKVLPRYTKLSEKEVKSVIFKTIENKITDLVRKSVRKPDSSLYACCEDIDKRLIKASKKFKWEEEDSFYDERNLHNITAGLYQLRSITDLDQEQTVMLTEFADHIDQFGNSLKNDKHQQFIKALIDPPVWMEERWEELRWTKGYQ